MRSPTRRNAPATQRASSLLEPLDTLDTLDTSVINDLALGTASPGGLVATSNSRMDA